MKSWDNAYTTQQYMERIQEANEDMKWDSQVAFNLVLSYS